MSAPAGSVPVTALITRQVHPGREAEFEQLMTGMRTSAAGFLGHLGGYLIHPEDAGLGCYRMLFAFDTEPHLQAWTGSIERKAWLERIARVTYGETATRMLTGMEGWFALPAAQTRGPPPRWKMAVVTWLGIFPLVLVLSQLVGPWLVPIHPLLSVMVVTALVTLAMTWLVMPGLARLFAGWLYPKLAESLPDGPNRQPSITQSAEKP